MAHEGDDDVSGASHKSILAKVAILKKWVGDHKNVAERFKLQTCSTVRTFIYSWLCLSFHLSAFLNLRPEIRAATFLI